MERVRLENQVTRDKNPEREVTCKKFDNSIDAFPRWQMPLRCFSLSLYYPLTNCSFLSYTWWGGGGVKAETSVFHGQKNLKGVGSMNLHSVRWHTVALVSELKKKTHCYVAHAENIPHNLELDLIRSFVRACVR